MPEHTSSDCFARGNNILIWPTTQQDDSALEKDELPPEALG